MTEILSMENYSGKTLEIFSWQTELEIIQSCNGRYKRPRIHTYRHQKVAEHSSLIMKLKILLLFIVGFIALAGAVPLETPEEDAKLEPAVEDPGKETAEEESSPEINDSEQDEDDSQNTSEDEDETDQNDKEDEPEENPESEVAESEQDPAELDAEKRLYKNVCRFFYGYKRICSPRRKVCKYVYGRKVCRWVRGLCRRVRYTIKRCCTHCSWHRRCNRPHCYWLWLARKKCYVRKHKKYCCSVYRRKCLRPICRRVRRCKTKCRFISRKG